MNTSESRWKYEEIFDDEAKIHAFDEIAKKYYCSNFGSTSKSDFDTLMFSLYLEQILDKSEDDINTYSDYTLAKQLGITQSKVSTLKVKKQLQYPYEKFDWRKSFSRVCKNARVESGKIKINLRDKNLYYELKNQIDEWGGYIEGSLTANLLIISPEEFLELSKMFMTDEDIKELKKIINKRYRNNEKLIDCLEKESTMKIVKKQVDKDMIPLILEVVKMVAPGSMGVGIEILKNGFNAIIEHMKTD